MIEESEALNLWREDLEQKRRKLSKRLWCEKTEDSVRKAVERAGITTTLRITRGFQTFSGAHGALKAWLNCDENRCRRHAKVAKITLELNSLWMSFLTGGQVSA